jgi:hypothetical protein
MWTSQTKTYKFKNTETCAICGKKFDVEYEATIIFWFDGIYPYREERVEMLTKAWHQEYKKGIGDWVGYELVEEDGKYKIKRCIPLYKYIYLRLRDFKRLLFHQYETIHLWICPNCVEEEDAIIYEGDKK